MIPPLKHFAPLWALALMLPVPAVEAKVIAIPMCNGGAQRLALPNGPAPLPGQNHDCCGKACHAGSDRRKKSGLIADCC